MDYHSGSSAICARSMPLSHLQEKENLLRLNELSVVSTSHSLFRSTKNLDEEVVNLKNIYETELEKLRKDIEAGARERNALQAQVNNQQTFVWELQNKLSMETDKNSKLMEEISILQRKIGDLDSELQDRQIMIQQPQESLDQLHILVGNLSREVDQWKHRCEHEQLTSQEKEKRLQQLIKKAEFSDQVHDQQIKYYQARLDVASATILNLEARIQEMNVTGSINELPKQPQADESKADLNCQVESLKEHTRKVAVARFIEGLMEGENQGCVDNLAKGTHLLQHNKALEGATTDENSQAAAGNIQELLRKIRDVYDMLTVKMTDVAGESESNIKLQFEVEALKVLLEKEERRLEVPSDKDTTPALQAKPSKTADTDQALATRFSEALQEKNCQAGIRVRNYEAMADRQKAGATSGANNTSQLLASFPTANAATSVPITSYGTTDYDYRFNNLYTSGATSSVYPYEQSPPINTFYIPKELRTVEKCSLVSSADFDANLGISGFHMAGDLLPMTGPQYSYNALCNQKHLCSDSSQPLRVLGPIHARSMFSSAQAHITGAESNGGCEAKTNENERNLNTINFESNHDYNVPHERPKSGHHERLVSSLSSSTDAASSAVGDLKILEVSEDGKFVKLLNDGPIDFDFGGYMVQQIVNDHPVAVFRFPPHTKFPPDSTITVWSAMNDPSVHNPPTDFFVKQQKKWETGPKCTTALCGANGQMVAWTRAGHRFTVDAFHETSTSKQGIVDDDDNDSQTFEDEAGDHETLTELKVDLSGPKPEPVYLRRAKKQPPTLTNSKHPHGFSPASHVHPLTGQPRPLYFGNDNSTYSRQSRTQTIRPDPVSRQPCSSAPVKRTGIKTSRGSEQRAHSAAVKENETLAKKCALSIGETCEGPSPFMRPHNRFDRGLDQVCSQHHHDFLPPMPKTSW